MSKQVHIPIHDIASLYNVTSRTLRYWEEKELFSSFRDSDSNWRVYDHEAIERIRLVLLLRELDISIKDIKKILDYRDTTIVVNVLKTQINKFMSENKEIMDKVNMLNSCLSAVHSLNQNNKNYNFLVEVEQTLAPQIISKETLNREREEMIMTNNPILTGALRIVSLSAMRVAVCNVVSKAPEEEALTKIMKWAQEENLMGTARIFGFNTTSYSPSSQEYGWAACITIPEHVLLPDYLEERRLPGGLYAAFNSTNEVYDSWQMLTRLLKECNEYVMDQSRLCLEEHIPTSECREQKLDFYLTLLEPVKKTNL